MTYHIARNRNHLEDEQLTNAMDLSQPSNESTLSSDSLWLGATNSTPTSSAQTDFPAGNTDAQTVHLTEHINQTGMQHRQHKQIHLLNHSIHFKAQIPEKNFQKTAKNLSLKNRVNHIYL